MKDYIIDPRVIIRTPRNSFNELRSFQKKSIETLFYQADIQDALYIASSDLYEKLKKFSQLEEKDKERVKNSFMRYISRMCTRCTPFGLFAGCSLGRIEEYTNLVISKKIIRHTRLDMNYLCSLSQYLSEIPEIKYKLKYYPNNSLYRIGNEYRYIEYHYLKDKRVHQMVSVKRTFYLDEIFRISKEGVLIENLYSYITDNYIKREDAINYINDLIQSQLLISELDPTITGDDFLTRILSILDCINLNNQTRDLLKSIQKLMMHIDKSENNPINNYKEIELLVKNIGVPYNNKVLFQVDINNVFINNGIGLSIKEEIESTVKFLNKIIPFRKNDDLSKFQESFTKRFEEQEIPLLLALDPEVGIGYPINYNQKDISPLLNDFNLPDKENLQNRNYNIIQTILLNKICKQSNLSQEIELKDSDFKDDKKLKGELPNTFSAFLEIIRDNGNDVLIRLKSIGNNSAANLLARFAYTDPNIEDFVKEITQKEQAMKSKVILAEIAHLPDSQVGNVLYRPHFRNYEIVYLANSSMSKDKVIYASDIMLSVKYGKLFLRSKRLNKEIIPHLTNAHNYSSSAIPLYRFLGDMQHNNQRPSLLFDIGFLKDELSYIPRIRYKHTILSPARWNIKIDEIKHLISIKDDKDLIYEANIWRKKKKIPIYSLLSDWDNDLFIDWNNIISLHAFLSVVKNRENFHLIEFLYNEKDAVIRDKKGNGYLNEFIVTLVRNSAG